jgi:hypothetical protein
MHAAAEKVNQAPQLLEQVREILKQEGYEE